jgi:hypothetical protein
MSTLYPHSKGLAHLLAHPPAPGSGRHTWGWRVMLSGKAQAVDFDDFYSRLVRFYRDAGWHDRLGDLARDRAKLAGGQAVSPGPKVWMPAVDPKIREAALKAPPLFDLLPKPVSHQEVLSALFRAGDLVCVAACAERAITMPRDAAIALAPRMQFVVANPMRALTGTSKEGNISRRCLDNACLASDRRYIVIEFDDGGSPDDQTRLLSFLHCREAPLTLALHSGGKSIHAWYNVSTLLPAGKLSRFRHGVLLGCDKSLWDVAKLVRMPGGLRDTGVRQQVLYWESEHAA